MNREWDTFGQTAYVARSDDPHKNTKGILPGYGRGGTPADRFKHHQKARAQFVPWLAERMAEALRVLKPGGHALVWALPKTSHWTGTALEEAGFEVRDRIHHVFGSGFPKSLDVGKAIDKQAGAEREIVGSKPSHYPDSPSGYGSVSGKGGVRSGGLFAPPTGDIHDGRPVTAPATDDAKAWDGWGTALKPAVEDWWLCRKPFRQSVAENVLEHGTGAINIGATRVGNDWENDPTRPESWKRSAVSAKPDAEKIAAPPGQGMILDPGGRWPANIVLTHGEGCGAPPEPGMDWDCEDGCPVKEMDGQSGTLSSRVFGQAAGEKTQTAYGKYAARNIGGYTDSGGASRYFNVFYSPKASRREREAGCDELPVKTGGEMTGRVDGSAGLNNPHAGAGRGGGRRNFHPTVKSLSLMDWLVRLITPPGGVVLDPFTGSGSTGVAAVRAGFQFLGVELTEEYLPIILARLAHAAAESEAT